SGADLRRGRGGPRRVRQDGDAALAGGLPAPARRRRRETAGVVAMAAADLIDEILVRWEELRQQGRVVAAEELCRDHPELLDEVRRLLAPLESLDRLRG